MEPRPPAPTESILAYRTLAASLPPHASGEALLRVLSQSSEPFVDLDFPPTAQSLGELGAGARQGRGGGRHGQV